MSSPDKRRFQLSILQKVTLGFVAALLLMAVRSMNTYHNVSRISVKQREMSATFAVLEAQEKLRRDLQEAKSAEREYGMTGGSDNLFAYKAAAEAVPQDLEQLKALSGDDAIQQARLERMEPLIQRELAHMGENIAARQAPRTKTASEARAKIEDSGLMMQIENEMSAFERDGQNLLARLNISFEHKVKVAMAALFFGTVGGALFLGTGLWWTRRSISRRGKVEEELAEERNLLSVLIETIPHMVYVKDVEGRYVMDNSAHRNHIGASDVSEVNGTRASDYFPAEIARLYAESDSKVLQLKGSVIAQEEPGVDREGNLVWFATTKMPLYDTGGTVVGLVALSEDITERKHAEERLRHYAEQMERSNKELQEFASIASHDLQEPLRKIMAFGHRLKTTCGGVLGEQGSDYLARMQNAAERMQTLISDLLTLSRVTSNARPFKKVDLMQIAKEVVSDLEVQIEQSGAEVEVGFLPEIEADPVQMRQLFQNLFSNGLKFQRKGAKPHVAICGKIVEMKDYNLPGVLPGEEACKIMVKDNGIGFSKEYSEKIFALFQRLHGRAEYEGTGIGLAVCRKITDRHGGSIVAKSSEGDGATFIVTLPVIQTPETNHEH